MATSPATASMKALIVILSLAAMPAVSFAQATGGSAGSTGGSSGSTTGGVANSPAPPPGTNSLGTAQSSGPGTGSGAAADATVNTENRQLDKKMKSICRGC